MADKKKRPNEQTEENKYKDGTAKTNTSVDLNSINFRNRDVTKFNKPDPDKKPKNTTKKPKPNSTSSNTLAFGNTVLGKRRKAMFRRKKNNRLA